MNIINKWLLKYNIFIDIDIVLFIIINKINYKKRKKCNILLIYKLIFFKVLFFIIIIKIYVVIF